MNNELKSWKMGGQGWVIAAGNLRNLRTAFCKHSLNGSSLIARFFRNEFRSSASE